MTRTKRAKLLVSATIAIIILILVFGTLSGEKAVVTDFGAKNLSPSAEHIFGTDWLGRDMLSRTLKGLSLSVVTGMAASAVSALMALIIGGLGASGGKRTDAVLGMLTDACMGLPHILLMLLISLALGGGTSGAATAVALTHWPGLSRVIRGEILQLKESLYIKIASKLGSSPMNIFRKHYIVHLLPQLVTGTVLAFPHAVIHESSLTFLGFGPGSGEPAIGVILSESMQYLMTGTWWLALFPGVSLAALTMLLFAAGNSARVLLLPQEEALAAGGNKRITSGIGRRRTAKTLRLKGNRQLQIDDSFFVGNGKPEPASGAVLSVRNLTVSFPKEDEAGISAGFVNGEASGETLKGVDADLRRGKITAVIGASGSGKSLLGEAMTGWISETAEVSGKICLDGEETTADRLRALSGKRISVIPQRLSGLDPLRKIGKQITRGDGSRKAFERAKAALAKVNLDERLMERYPFELSGGMARRLLIAMAIFDGAKIIIADEPSPGIGKEETDRILTYFRALADDGAAMLLITHELSAAEKYADEILVMRSGRITDRVSGDDFRAGRFYNPYTRALYDAAPENGFKMPEPEFADFAQGETL